VSLDDEQCDQYQKGNRQHRKLRVRCRHMQTFDGAQYRYRGRDRAIREKQRSAQNTQGAVELSARARPRRVDHQGGQRQYAALAFVIGVEHHHHVLQQDDENQRPKDQRQHAENMVRSHGNSGPHETGRHGIQGARADIAEDNAERRKRHGREPLTRMVLARHLGANLR
jgi:hypothetical protein